MLVQSLRKAYPGYVVFRVLGLLALILICYALICRQGTPVVYVNFNYRLGPLGYPVGDEAEARGALNLGDKDAIAALRWVQNNIGAFGGDKDKVCYLFFLNDSDHAQAALIESR